MQVPKIIESQQKLLVEMLERDDSPYLNVQEVGKFLGTDPDCIRASAEGGKCPFAFGGEKRCERSTVHQNPQAGLL